MLEIEAIPEMESLRMLGLCNKKGHLCHPATHMDPTLRYVVHLGNATYKPTEAEGQRVAALLQTLGFQSVKVTPVSPKEAGIEFFDRRGNLICIFVEQAKSEPAPRSEPAPKPKAPPIAPAVTPTPVKATPAPVAAATVPAKTARVPKAKVQEPPRKKAAPKKKG